MTESLRENIYKNIRDDIMQGKLLPGQRLVESMLVERFKVSRSPIREALRRLESEGMITFEHNKGITVSRLSGQEIEEIYNLRWLLESYATHLSAERATRNDVTYLKNLNSKLKTAAKNYDLMSWIHNNVLFHDFLSENSGNGNLTQVLSTIKRRVYRYHYMIIRIPGHFKTYLDQHEGILRACENNDGKSAERYMKAHLQTIKRVLIDYLDKFPGF
jgi:DNA-binding GntR family transcriptional regulator